MEAQAVTAEGGVAGPGEMVRPRRSTFCGQLWTMLRRNLLLKRRSLKMTIAEIVIPCIFLAEFVLLGTLMNKFNTAYPAVQEFEEQPFSYPSIPLPPPLPDIFYPVGCTPDSNMTREMMKQAAEYWHIRNSSSILQPIFFSSEAEMEKAYLNLSSKGLGGIGVVFEDREVLNLNYTLRFPSQVMPPTSKPYIRRNIGCRPFGNFSNETTVTPGACFTNEYIYTGFAALQNVLTAAYAKIRFNISDGALLLSTKMLPDGPTKLFQGGAAVAPLPASYLSNLIGFYVIFIVIFVVNEKEKKLIASMEIMGLRPAVYWLSWVLMYLTIMLLVSTIALVLAKVLSIWPESSFPLLLIDCMLYGASVIAFGFCVAPLFRRPLIAGLVTYALMTAFGFLYLLETFLPNMSDGARWGLAVLSPTAFFMSMARVSEAESNGWGIGFGNALGDLTGFTFGFGLIMLSADLLFYTILAVYLEKVFPSDDSPKQRPWFFLLPSHWIGSRKALSSLTSQESSIIFQNSDIESVPREIRARTAISTHGLRKVFPGKTDAVAVDGFTYEMYEDEILAILGHNGAGKTTLINMITGMLAPTSGTAVVYGNDVTDSEQLNVARTMIGICPQHDVLFDTFTVREHIEFYARLKGFSNSHARIEFERIIDQIGMRTQADVQAQKLSGGQKRRLSIAIAVVGNPKVLILDEPTSGVDPYSRRFLWDMIRDFRKGRCIIITTQSMQEADVFADRKLIISHGKLRCAGTSLFLKNRFGLGYHLTMSVDRDFNETQVEEFVTSRIAGSTKARAHAGEISFVLPKSGVAGFPSLFNELDQHLVPLKIQTYGVSLTTMEEIFLKLADAEVEDANMESKDLVEKDKISSKGRDYSRLASTTFAVPTKGAVSSWTKFLALSKIRFLLLFRSRLFFIFQILIPFLLLLMNGILSTLARGYITMLMSTDSLNIEDLAADFQTTGTKFFYSNKTSSLLNKLIEGMGQLGVAFEPQDYGNLLEVAPHYAGYIFRNETTFNQTVAEATICYNSSATHAIPFATNLLLNAVFRLRTGINETFHVAAHPFPATEASPALLINSAFGASLVGLALVMIPGVYGIDICRDRQLKIRSQIRMTGCSLWLYWGSSFVVHLIQFALSFGMIIALLYAFSVTSITDAIGCIVVLFSLHAPAMVLFSYCASFLFSKYETAALGLPFPMAMIAFICYFVVLVLDAFGEETSSLILHGVFSFVLPFYGFFGALIFLQKVGIENAVAAAKGSGVITSYFDWDSNIPMVFVAHAVQIPLLILLVIYLESRHFNQSWLQFFGFRRKSSSPQSDILNVHNLAPEDDDVQRERTRVQGMNLFVDSSYAIVLRSLWKSFDSRSSLMKGLTRFRRKTPAVEEKVAVRNISLVFPKGEVFGLLGPNGAGKTTTLSMISGEVTPSSGDVHVNGFNINTQTLSAIETMGSCPQTDTIWDDITMEEHLKLFAILNDLPASRSEDSIKIFSEGLCITEHMQKKAAALSGGTKRKLTFVISMIGNPPLVLLDEPSTGMDPRSKRNLWDMIMQSFDGNRGAILTTHSMEEADALCDRIGIIVKGELQCIGSSQHLKDKFGSGYVLEAKLSLQSGTLLDGQEHKAIVSRLKSEIGEILPGVLCAEEFFNRLVFTVPKANITSLGTVFAELDRVKQLLGLEEYSFSQTTIEQVFLHFAKMQEIPEDSIGSQQTFPGAPMAVV